MAVSFHSSFGVQTGTTSCVITGCAETANDICLLWVFHKGTGTPVLNDSNWNFFTSIATTAGLLYVYWLKSTSSGTRANVTATGLTSSSAGSMGSFTGVDLNSPFLRETSFNLRYKTQANLEGTYGTDNTTKFFDWASGDMAVGICALDNDASASYAGATTLKYTTGGSNFGTSMTEIADGMTTGGTDCGGSWGYAGQVGDLCTGFTPAITEGSAGTADNANALIVLRSAITASNASTLTDNFDDNSLSSNFYSKVSVSASATETNQRLELASSVISPQDAAILSASRYALDTISIKIPTDPTAGGSEVLYFGMTDGDAFFAPDSSGVLLKWDLSAGTLAAIMYSAGSASTVTVTYTTTTRASNPYWRITRSSNSITFQYGDGTAWSTIRTATYNDYDTNQWHYSNLRLYIAMSASVSGTRYFDDLNITTTMTAVGKNLQLIWNVNQPPIGKNLQLVWDDKALVNKSLQLVWNDLVPVNKSLQLVWNVRSVVGKALGLVWNTIATVGKSLQAVWDTKAVIAKSLQLIWNDLVPINKSLQLVWNTRAVAGKDLQLVWNVAQNTTTAVGKDLQLIWNLAAPVGKNNQLVWNTRANVNKDLQVIWNDRTLIGKDLQLVWNDKATIGKNLALIWNVTAPVGKSLQVIWNVRSTIGKDSQLVWNVRSVLGKNLQVIWNVNALVNKDLQLVWNTLANNLAVGKDLSLVWNTRAPISKSLQLIWTVYKVVRVKILGADILSPTLNTQFNTDASGWSGKNANSAISAGSGTLQVTRTGSSGFAEATLPGGGFALPAGTYRLRARIHTSGPTFAAYVQLNTGGGSYSLGPVIGSNYITDEMDITIGSSTTITDFSLGSNTSVAAGTVVEVDWIELRPLNDDLTLRWNVLTPVGKNLQLVWNIVGPVGKDLTLVWNTRSVIGKALQLLWTVNTKVLKDLTLRWNILTFVGKSLSPVWNVRAAVGKDLSLYWNVLFTFTWTDIIYDSDIWTDTVYDSDVYTQYDPGTDIWTDVVPPGTVWS